MNTKLYNINRATPVHVYNAPPPHHLAQNRDQITSTHTLSLTLTRTLTYTHQNRAQMARKNAYTHKHTHTSKSRSTLALHPSLHAYVCVRGIFKMDNNYTYRSRRHRRRSVAYMRASVGTADNRALLRTLELFCAHIQDLVVDAEGSCL